MTIQNTNTSLLNDKMVDMAFITTFSGLSDKCFYKLIKDDVFPKPSKLDHSSRWMQSETENWVQNRINQSRQ
ncbi:helix-turn-helix transcriptional regulator [Serratia fonticola]|uniref:helix-turn-helix transcriptional regulator n=1 Tax=Serratia fonticola TaxID=47917 RepID=UPI0034C69DD2